MIKALLFSFFAALLFSTDAAALTATGDNLFDFTDSQKLESIPRTFILSNDSDGDVEINNIKEPLKNVPLSPGKGSDRFLCGGGAE
jgi:hypothetical protein